MWLFVVDAMIFSLVVMKQSRLCSTHNPFFFFYTAAREAIIYSFFLPTFVCRIWRLGFTNKHPLFCHFYCFICADFEDLGFARPPNMNPADFIMDVLGGEIRHVEGKTIDFKVFFFS